MPIHQRLIQTDRRRREEEQYGSHDHCLDSIYFQPMVGMSYEPALGPLSICGFADKPDWIICGGESGEVTRPMEQRWAEDLLEECREFGVAFFMKQMTARTPKVGMKLIPPDLLVRQDPVTPFTHR